MLSVDPEKKSDTYDETFPIHSACYNKASKTAILSLFKDLDKWHAANDADEDGYYPLHIAICKNCCLGVIKLLLKLNPGAAAIRFPDCDRLPVFANCATKYQSPPDVIRALLEAYPQAEEGLITLSRSYANDGSHYVGQFSVYGQRSGQGVLKYADGVGSYTGSWQVVLHQH